MKAKLVNENFPPGAEYDPRAPYNDGDEQISVDVNDFGEIELNYINRREKETVDPYNFDHYIADRENIPIEEIEDNEGVQILGVENLNNDNYILHTNFGKLKISLDELESLL